MRFAIVATLCISTAAFAETPADQAKAFVTKQLELITKNDDKGFKATFSDDAVVLGYVPDQAVKSQDIHVREVVTSGSPHDVFKKIKLEKIVAAGGDANVLWLTAEIATTFDSYDEGAPAKKGRVQRMRLTEVLVPDGSSWKVVAGALTPIRTPAQSLDATVSAMDGTTKPGPLAPLAASPSELIKKLSTDKNTFVLGTDKNERAVGPAAAKKLLGQWSKLKLEIDEKSVREVSTKSHAFAQVNVAYAVSKPKKETVYHQMRALIIAMPNGSDWSVVGVHYVPE